MSVKPRTVDPMLMVILSRRLEAIVSEMSNTLIRAGRSGVLVTARDFSCGISDSETNLLSVSEKVGLPFHIASMGFIARAVKNIHGQDVKPGDCFLNNSPYTGNLHHADFTLCVPVFYKDELLFYAMNRAHQADVGAPTPSTYLPFSRTIYEEGLHFPCIRVQRNWENLEDWIRMCKLKIRAPEQWYGDFLGMIGSVRIAERRLIELCEQYGVSLIKPFLEEWLNYGERRMIEEIRRLPRGAWGVETRHDPVPSLVPEGIPLKVKLTIDPDEAYITIDYRDNIDCIAAGFNLPEASAYSIAVVGSMFWVDPTIPHNQGTFRRIKVRTRENCIVGGLKFPCGASVGTTNCADRLFNAVMVVFSKAGEELGMAEAGLGMPASNAVIAGHDWRRGTPYVNQVMVGIFGGGALAGHDGWLTNGIPIVQGMILQDSIEINELKHPIMYDCCEIAIDSGGPGQWEGAPGSRVICGPRKHPGTWTYPNDGHFFPPKGVRGGLNGGASDVWKFTLGSEKRIDLPQFGSEVITSNERIVSISSGGGGYGDPLRRDPEKVRWRAREGYISLERAQRDYGVVLDTKMEEYAVDYDATEKLRTHLPKKPQEGEK